MTLPSEKRHTAQSYARAPDARAYTSADQNMLDNLVVERFREGHGNEELKKHLCLYPSTGLQDLIGGCVKFETHVQIGSRAHKSNEGLYTVQGANQPELTSEEVTCTARKLGYTLRPWIDRQQGNRGFNNAGPSQNQNGGEPQQESRFSQNRNSGARPQNPIRKQTPIGEIKCWTCGKAGHYASDCKTNVDPGAVVSAISLQCYEKLVDADAILTPLRDMQMELEAANKSDMKVHGMCNLELSVHGLSINIDAVVVDLNCQAILGMDILGDATKLPFILDLVDGTLSGGGYETIQLHRLHAATEFFAETTDSVLHPTTLGSDAVGQAQNQQRSTRAHRRGCTCASHSYKNLDYWSADH